MTALGILGRGLEGAHSPYGIVSFEFAGDLAAVERMLEGWGEPGRTLAGFHLGLDFLFLVLYPSCIALACGLAVARLHPRHKRWAQLGAWVAWGQVLAGLLDALENTALLGLLLGRVSAPLPCMTWWCAAGKFALVGAGLVFLVPASVLSMTAGARKP